jgi:hypothetical protein
MTSVCSPAVCVSSICRDAFGGDASCAFREDSSGFYVVGIDSIIMCMRNLVG